MTSLLEELEPRLAYHANITYYGLATFYENRDFVINVEDREERLFYILLRSFFWTPKTATPLYRVLNWNTLVERSGSVEGILDEFFHRQTWLIKPRRRHFQARNPDRKVKFMLELVETYRDLALFEHGSQQEMLEVGRADASFDRVFHRLSKVLHLKTRSPRYDFLEGVSKDNNCYLIPTHSYLIDAPNPLDGFSWVFHGYRYRKNKFLFTENIMEDFVVRWNAEIGGEYYLASNDFVTNIPVIERWLIKTTGERLNLEYDFPPHPHLSYNVESAFCGVLAKHYEGHVPVTFDRVLLAEYINKQNTKDLSMFNL